MPFVYWIDFSQAWGVEEREQSNCRGQYWTAMGGACKFSVAISGLEFSNVWAHGQELQPGFTEGGLSTAQHHPGSERGEEMRATLTLLNFGHINSVPEWGVLFTTELPHTPADRESPPWYDSEWPLEPIEALKEAMSINFKVNINRYSRYYEYPFLKASNSVLKILKEFWLQCFC